MNGISNFQTKRDAMVNGCEMGQKRCKDNCIAIMWSQKQESQIRTEPYTENCDEPINRRYLKTCKACNISSPKESHVD